MKGEYTGGPFVSYSCTAGTVLFERRCVKCGRIVKADDVAPLKFEAEEQPSWYDGHYEPTDGGECSRCGRVQMPFIGFS